MHGCRDECRSGTSRGKFASRSPILPFSHGLSLMLLLDLVPQHWSQDHALYRRTSDGGTWNGRRSRIEGADPKSPRH